MDMQINEITMTGNIVFDPRFSSGENRPSRCTFRIAHTPRRYQEAKGGWVDGETTFMDVVCWRTMAENAVESLEKGMPVLVTGRLTSSSPDQDSQSTASARKVTYYQIDATAIGINLARVATQLRPASSVKSAAVERQEERAITEASAEASPPF
jgi:single-strand DNA-binding protein